MSGRASSWSATRCSTATSTARSRRIAPDAPAPVLDEAARARPARRRRRWPRCCRPAGARGRAGHRARAPTTARAPGCASCCRAGVEVFALPLAGPTPEKIRLRAGGQALLRLDRGGPARRPGAPLDAAGCDVLARRPTPCWSPTTAAGWPRRPAAARARWRAAAARPVVWDPHPRGAAPVPGARWSRRTWPRSRALTGATRRAPRAGRPPAEALRAALAGRRGRGDRGARRRGPLPRRPTPAGRARAGRRRRATPAAPATGSPPPRPSRWPRRAGVGGGRAAVAAAAGYVAAGGAGRRVRRAAGAGAAPAPRSDAAASSPRCAPRGGTVVATGGCFDLLHAGHVATLRGGPPARRLPGRLPQLRRLRAPAQGPGPAGRHGRPTGAACSRRWTASTPSWSSTRTTRGGADRLRPDVWVKGGDYAGADLPEAELVRRWGGRVVLVPYLRPVHHPDPRPTPVAATSHRTPGRQPREHASTARSSSPAAPAASAPPSSRAVAGGGGTPRRHRPAAAGRRRAVGGVRPGRHPRAPRRRPASWPSRPAALDGVVTAAGMDVLGPAGRRRADLGAESSPSTCSPPPPWSGPRCRR